MKVLHSNPAWFGFFLALINIVVAPHEQLIGTSYILLCNGDHCYHKQMERMVNLSEARSTCEGTLGGYVVHLETMDEQTWLMNSFMAVGESVSMYWIGLERAGGISSDWYWMSGSSFSLATNLTNRWSPYPLSTDTTAVASGSFFMAYQNDSSAAFVCETEGSPYNDYCFENTSVTFYKSPGSNVYNYMPYMADFDNARAACEAYPNTHLLTLETTDEHTWINTMVPETSAMNIYWLGLRRGNIAEDWYWLFADNVTQPMNHSSFDGMYSEDLYAYNEYNMWKKSSRFMVRHFICETEIETAVESSLASSSMTPSSLHYVSTKSFSSTPFVSYTTVPVSNSIYPTDTYVLPTHTTVLASGWMDPTNASLTTSAPAWIVPTNTTLIATGASSINLSSYSNIVYDSAIQPLSVTPTINVHTLNYTTSGSTLHTYDSFESEFDSFTPSTVTPSSVSFHELANSTYFATNTATPPMSNSVSNTMTPFVTTTPSSIIVSANVSLQLNSFATSGTIMSIINATSLTQSGPNTHLSSAWFSTSDVISSTLSQTSTTMTMSLIILSTTSPTTITSSISHSYVLTTSPITPSTTISSASHFHAVSTASSISSTMTTTAQTAATTSPTAATTSPTPATTSPIAATTSPTAATTSPTPATTSPTPATTSPTPATTSPIAATTSPTPATITLSTTILSASHSHAISTASLMSSSMTTTAQTAATTSPTPATVAPSMIISSASHSHAISPTSSIIPSMTISSASLSHAISTASSITPSMIISSVSHSHSVSKASSISSSMTTTSATISPTPAAVTPTPPTTSLTEAITPTAPTLATTSSTAPITSSTPTTTPPTSETTLQSSEIISSTSVATSPTSETTSQTPAITSSTPTGTSPTPTATSPTTSATASISLTTHSNTTSTTLSGNTTATTAGPSSTIYSPSLDARIFTPWNVACGQGCHIFVKQERPGNTTQIQSEVQTSSVIRCARLCKDIQQCIEIHYAESTRTCVIFI